MAVQAAMGFHRVFKIVIPHAPRLKASVVREVQGREFGIGSEANVALADIDIAIERGVLPR